MAWLQRGRSSCRRCHDAKKLHQARQPSSKQGLRNEDRTLTLLLNVRIGGNHWRGSRRGRRKASAGTSV